jgi:hypothetical protein
MRHIKILEKYKWIIVKKKKGKNGRWLNNTYYFNDFSEWIIPSLKIRGPLNKSPPCDNLSPSHVTNCHSNNNHKNNKYIIESRKELTKKLTYKHENNYKTNYQ